MELEVLEARGHECLFLQVRCISSMGILTQGTLRLILEYARLMSSDRAAVSYSPEF
jgi:hypothetical protein